MRSLIIAFQFLTRIPMPALDGIGPREAGRSLRYYPLVGLVLGLLLAGLNGLFAGVPDGLRAALLLAAWVLLTGGLHLDGLADSADAWLGGFGDRERTLAIMKDPRSGPAAILLLVLLLLIKFAALEALIAAGDGLALIAAPLLARALLPVLFLSTPYVRPGGLGCALAEQASAFEGLWLPVLISLALLLSAGWRGFGLLVAVAAVFLLLRGMMLKRIGGTTGDTAGALLEVTEATVLVAAVLLD